MWSPSSEITGINIENINKVIKYAQNKNILKINII